MHTVILINSTEKLVALDGTNVVLSSKRTPWNFAGSYCGIEDKIGVFVQKRRRYNDTHYNSKAGC